MKPAAPLLAVPFLDAYRSGGFASKGPAWLRGLREEAMARYAATGLPSTKDPAWAHTELREVAATPYRPAPAGARVEAAAADAHHFTGEGPRLVFVDGRLDARLSRTGKLPLGVRLEGLADAVGRDDGPLRNAFARGAKDAVPWASLNLGFLEDGALLRLDKGAVAPEPIHLLWLASGAHAEPAMVHPRLLVLAGEGSQATLVETHAGLGTAPTLTNAVAEIDASPGSVVRHVRIQRETYKAAHFHTLRVRQERASRVETFLLSLGAGTSRSETTVQLSGEGAETSADGLFLGTGRQSVECRIRVEHDAPHTTSRQLYKGILDGASRGAFYGSVLVRPAAQKTDASQTNRNLLLSPK
ncbi:MAG TPA: SufD family Fe-S cluster assembly protein, partial [Candidatus Thermoplasmatota archaeon]|nr:SufD family Fe-S cluster assembly protein [Candidatus Thermoplasmatota archaeon]